jgi:hypothetical protein
MRPGPGNFPSAKGWGPIWGLVSGKNGRLRDWFTHLVHKLAHARKHRRVEQAGTTAHPASEMTWTLDTSTRPALTHTGESGSAIVFPASSPRVCVREAFSADRKARDRA